METALLAYVLNGKLKTCLIAEYRFMLCAVIFKGAANILHKTNERHISDEDYNFNEACKNGSTVGRVGSIARKPACNSVGKEDKKSKRKRNTQKSRNNGYYSGKI